MDMTKTPIRYSIVWLVGLCLSGGAGAQVSFDIPVEEPPTYSHHYETMRLPVEHEAEPAPGQQRRVVGLVEEDGHAEHGHAVAAYQLDLVGHGRNAQF